MPAYVQLSSSSSFLERGESFNSQSLALKTSCTIPPAPIGEATDDCIIRDESSQFRLLLAMGSSSLAVWCTFPLVTIASKCLLTSNDQCTRWGPDKGADFHYPVTVAAMNLLLVGGVLELVLLFRSSSSSSPVLGRGAWDGNRTAAYDSKGAYFEQGEDGICRHEETHVQENDSRSLPSSDSPPTDDGFSDDEDVAIRMRMRPTMVDKLKSCTLLGVAFASKYVVAHWALQMTPTLLYELFHCFNIVFIVVTACMVLGEAINSRWQVVGCAGMVLGCTVTVCGSLIETASIGTSTIQVIDISGSALRSILMLVMNLLNATLAGLCVTALKALSGAFLLIPCSLLMDGSAIFLMTSKQMIWMGLSSLAILVYHVNLSILCALSTSTTVGMIESLRAAPSFGIIVLVQGGQGHKDAFFWIGSAIMLMSTLLFEVSRWKVKRMSQSGIHSQNGEQVRNSIPNKKALREWQQGRESSKSSSACTERTCLLDSH